MRAAAHASVIDRLVVPSFECPRTLTCSSGMGADSMAAEKTSGVPPVLRGIILDQSGSIGINRDQSGSIGNAREQLGAVESLLVLNRRDLVAGAFSFAQASGAAIRFRTSPAATAEFKGGAVVLSAFGATASKSSR